MPENSKKSSKEKERTKDDEFPHIFPHVSRYLRKPSSEDYYKKHRSTLYSKIDFEEFKDLVRKHEASGELRYPFPNDTTGSSVKIYRQVKYDAIQESWQIVASLMKNLSPEETEKAKERYETVKMFSLYNVPWNEFRKYVLKNAKNTKTRPELPDRKVQYQWKYERAYRVACAILTNEDMPEETPSTQEVSEETSINGDEDGNATEIGDAAQISDTKRTENANRTENAIQDGTASPDQHIDEAEHISRPQGTDEIQDTDSETTLINGQPWFVHSEISKRVHNADD